MPAAPVRSRAIEGSSLTPSFLGIGHRPIARPRREVHGPAAVRAAGETVHRINQDARLSTQPARSRPIKGPESDRNPTGSARTAHASNQTIKGTDSAANRQPAGLARHDRSIRPRTNQANAVVMPQVGQSRPVTRGERTGPEPELGVRPVPRGSGTNVLANPKTPASPAAATTKQHREPANPAGDDPEECTNTGGPQHEWVIANDGPRSEGPSDRMRNLSERQDLARAKLKGRGTSGEWQSQEARGSPVCFLLAPRPSPLSSYSTHSSASIMADCMRRSTSRRQASMRLAVGVRRDDDRGWHDAGGGAERPGHAEPVPAPGPPRVAGRPSRRRRWGSRSGWRGRRLPGGPIVEGRAARRA